MRGALQGQGTHHPDDHGSYAQSAAVSDPTAWERTEGCGSVDWTFRFHQSRRWAPDNYVPPRLWNATDIRLALAAPPGARLPNAAVEARLMAVDEDSRLDLTHLLLTPLRPPIVGPSGGAPTAVSSSSTAVSSATPTAAARRRGREDDGKEKSTTEAAAAARSSPEKGISAIVSSLSDVPSATGGQPHAVTFFVHVGAVSAKARAECDGVRFRLQLVLTPVAPPSTDTAAKGGKRGSKKAQDAAAAATEEVEVWRSRVLMLRAREPESDDSDDSDDSDHAHVSKSAEPRGSVAAVQRRRVNGATTEEKEKKKEASRDGGAGTAQTEPAVASDGWTTDSAVSQFWFHDFLSPFDRILPPPSGADDLPNAPSKPSRFAAAFIDPGRSNELRRVHIEVAPPASDGAAAIRCISAPIVPPASSSDAASTSPPTPAAASPAESAARVSAKKKGGSRVRTPVAAAPSASEGAASKGGATSKGAATSNEPAKLLPAAEATTDSIGPGHHAWVEREILIVDPRADRGLAMWLRQSDAIAACVDVAQRATALLWFVAAVMGGASALDECAAEAALVRLRTARQRDPNHVCLGEIQLGLCRHRALLFKALCDRHRVPCFLMRGGVRNDATPSDQCKSDEFAPHTWCVVVGPGGPLLVDPTRAPSELQRWPDARYAGPMSMPQISTMSEFLALPTTSRSKSVEGEGGASPVPALDLRLSESHGHAVDDEPSPDAGTCGSVMGRGATAVVATCSFGGLMAVAKRPLTPAAASTLRREYAVLRRLQRLRCRNVVRPLGWTTVVVSGTDAPPTENATQSINHAPVAAMVLPLYSMSLLGALNYLAALGLSFCATQRRAIARSLLCALRDMHTIAGVVHCDVKAENVLLRVDRCDDCVAHQTQLCGAATCRVEAVLADLADCAILPPAAAAGVEPPAQQQAAAAGAARRDDRTVAHRDVGTPPYTAPEIEARQRIGTAVDMWSIGVVLCELHALALPSPPECGPPPGLPVMTSESFSRADEAIPRPHAGGYWCAIAADTVVWVPPVHETDPALRRVIIRCLHPLPYGRLSAAEAVALLDGPVEGNGTAVRQYFGW